MTEATAHHRGNFQECDPGFFLCPHLYNTMSISLNLVFLDTGQAEANQMATITPSVKFDQCSRTLPYPTQPQHSISSSPQEDKQHAPLHTFPRRHDAGRQQAHAPRLNHEYFVGRKCTKVPSSYLRERSDCWLSQMMASLL